MRGAGMMIDELEAAMEQAIDAKWGVIHIEPEKVLKLLAVAHQAENLLPYVNTTGSDSLRHRVELLRQAMMELKDE